MATAVAGVAAAGAAVLKEVYEVNTRLKAMEVTVAEEKKAAEQAQRLIQTVTTDVNASLSAHGRALEELKQRQDASDARSSCT